MGCAAGAISGYGVFVRWMLVNQEESTLRSCQSLSTPSPAPGQTAGSGLGKLKSMGDFCCHKDVSQLHSGLPGRLAVIEIKCSFSELKC